jgi:hypothetical protein
VILFALVVVAIVLLVSPHDAGEVPVPVASPIANPHQAKTLAQRFEPSLVLERQDGFWPISVETIDRLPPAEERPCLAPRRGAQCKRVTVEQLPWDGPTSAFLDYPAANDDPEGERRSFAKALGSEAPRTGAQLYFYLTGRSPQRPETLQYWFYYPFNYLPVRRYGVDLADVDLHEGDFEGLSVLLSAKAHRPVYVWMPRHTEEGERFTWNEGVLHRHGTHPIGFVAKGSHATYESCGRKFRTALVEHIPVVGRRVLDVPDDHVSCAPQDRYRLSADVPMVNLARTWWACWPGHLGNAPGLGSVPVLGQALEQIDADGPQSPLFQQKFDEDHPRPCADVPAPAPPVDEGEVLPDPSTARALDVRGGRLDEHFEDCPEWFQRPPEGSYLVACDQVRLSSFFESGLERPGHQGLAISGDPSSHGNTSIPAVFQSPRAGALGEATISTRETAHPFVYAALRDGNEMRTAEFPRFQMPAGSTLRLHRGASHWRLVNLGNGKTVARAPVKTTEAASPPKAPAVLAAVRHGDEVTASVAAGEDPGARLTVVGGSRRHELHPIAVFKAKPNVTYNRDLHDPDAQLRFLRAIATRDGVPAFSNVVSVSAGG